MARWLAIAFAAVVGLVAAEALAEKWSREVEVKWTRQTENEPNERSWTAYIPKAFITRYEQNDISGRFIGLTFDDGTYCSTVGSRNESINLSCGSHRGHYDLTAERQLFKLTWVTEDPSIGVGDK